MQKFKYKPLDTSRPSIRLLKLHQPNHITIFHSFLDECPPYDAISYTWGDAKTKKPISIDKQEFSVTQNLHDLLRALWLNWQARKDLPRDEERQRLRTVPQFNQHGGQIFWIDAICIDQSSNAEKSSQIMLMNDIYQHSARVLIWIGKPKDDSEKEAIANIYELKSFIQGYSKGLDGYGVAMMAKKWHNPASKLQTGGVLVYNVLPNGQRTDLRRPTLAEMRNEHQSPDIFEARLRYQQSVLPGLHKFEWDWSRISRLLSLPWFSRIWVLQELYAGKDVHVVYGLHMTTWDVFGDVCNKLVQYGLDSVIYHVEDGKKKFPAGLSNAVSMHSLRNSKSRGRLELAQLMLGTIGHKATDPRDKVFALLGMSAQADEAMLKPDYSLSTEQVFLSAATFMLTGKTKTFQILSAAGIGWQRSLIDLPSWVPDWSNPPSVIEDSCSRWFRPISTGENLEEMDDKQPNIKLGPTPRILRLRGHVVDEIAYTSPTPCPELDDDSREIWQWFFNTAEVAKDLCPYPTGGSVQEAYWRTLIANKNDLGGPAGGEYGVSFEKSMGNPFDRTFVVNEGDPESQRARRDVEIRALVEQLQHHATDPGVSDEMAYMDRNLHERSFELDRIWKRAYSIHGIGRCFFTTKKGFMGIAAPGIKNGDKIAYIDGGGETLLVLRPYDPPPPAPTALSKVFSMMSLLSRAQPDQPAQPAVNTLADEPEKFQLVCDCYFHGSIGFQWTPEELIEDLDVY